MVASHERYAEVAPAEPEHRERPASQPVALSAEEAAQQLADDPEFREGFGAQMNWQHLHMQDRRTP